MPVRETPVLLVGAIMQPAQNVYAYDRDTNTRTQNLASKKVMVATSQADEFGVTEVSIPIEDIEQYNLGQGASVCWWIRFGVYSIEGRSGVTARALQPANENAAQAVFEAFQHMTGVAESGKRDRAAV